MFEKDSLIEQILSNTDTVSKFLKDNIEKDIEKQVNDTRYSDTIIKEIIMSAQEFEFLMRNYIINKNKFVAENLWKFAGGDLLKEIENTKEFKPVHIAILRKAVELRNWVVHKIYEEKQKFSYSPEWIKYYREKLSITKYFIFEAIDFFTDAANIIKIFKY